jgi:hypothetical protein
MRQTWKARDTVERSPTLIIYLTLSFLISACFTGCGAQLKNEVFKEPADKVPLAYHQDFTKPATAPAVDTAHRRLPDGLKYRNVSNVGHVQPLPEGLLIKVQQPYTIQAGRGLGIETAFGLRGDFDITATYDNFRADAPYQVPGAGNGVGFGICIQPVKEQLIWISRMIRVNGDGIFWSKFGTKQEGYLATTEKAGRFRVLRSGPTLTCLWAPGNQDDNYQVLDRPNIGTNDIGSVWLHLFTSGQTLGVEARLLDLRIQGQKEANPVYDPSNGPRLASDQAGNAPKGLLAGVVLVGMVIAMTCALGLWLFMRKRRSRMEPNETS